MLDTRARRAIGPALDRTARALDRPGITPNRLTTAGLALGLLSALTASFALWPLALITWLLSRLADGVDGPLARRREQLDRGAGGFYDITADFCVYGSTVVGVAVGAHGAYGTTPWPFLAVLLTYYVNGTALLAFSSIAERSGRQRNDGRSLSFLGGIAEGTETIVVHSLWLVLPGRAGLIAGVWAAVVGVGAVERTVSGYRALR